jgi:hypothetical protein
MSTDAEEYINGERTRKILQLTDDSLWKWKAHVSGW